MVNGMGFSSEIRLCRSGLNIKIEVDSTAWFGVYRPDNHGTKSLHGLALRHSDKAECG